MLMICLSLNGHLVTVRIVNKRSPELFGNTFSHLVDSYTQLVMIVNGMHFVNCAIVAIVDLPCIPVFLCFISIMIKY